MPERPTDSRGFRRALRGEMKEWLADGLISGEQAEALEKRYSFGDLGEGGRRLLIATIYVIGAVLIAGGVISFVAAHWESIPSTAKVALLFAAMLGAHISGYILWRVKRTKPALGHALVMLGTLIFGANIALMAQIFHITGTYPGVFLSWSIGAAVVGYLMLSVPNAVIAIVTSFIWFCAGFFEHPSGLILYPVVLLAAGLPLAYRKRSAVLFFLLLAAFSVSAQMAVWAATEDFQALSLTGISIALALTGYAFFHLVAVPIKKCAAVSLILGGVVLGLWSYLLSFRELADEMEPWGWVAGQSGAWILLFAAGLLIVAVAFHALTARGILAKTTMRHYVAATWTAGALMIVVCGIGWGEALVVLLSNAAFLVLAAGLISSGMVSLRRGVFWCGVALVAALIVGRFLEYDFSLLLKAVVFVACGVGVIASGVKFENLLKIKETASE